MGPVGAALARHVSLLALEDGAVAGDGEADGALEDLPQLPLDGVLPRFRLIQLEFQGVERFLRHVDKCGWEYDQRFLVRMLMMARVVLGSSFWQLGCNSVGLSRCVKP